jgi:hypothetical protein
MDTRTYLLNRLNEIDKITTDLRNKAMLVTVNNDEKTQIFPHPRKYTELIKDGFYLCNKCGCCYSQDGNFCAYQYYNK